MSLAAVPLTELVPVSLVYGLTLLLGALGNLLVIVSICRFRRLHSVTNVFLVNLFLLTYQPTDHRRGQRLNNHQIYVEWIVISLSCQPRYCRSAAHLHLCTDQGLRGNTRLISRNKFISLVKRFTYKNS